MRVYLPATLPALARLLRSGEIGPAPVRGFAVTPALREWYASGDLEELEYVAMTHAARASLRMLLDEPDAPRRRVVLAAEVPGQVFVHRQAARLLDYLPRRSGGVESVFAQDVPVGYAQVLHELLFIVVRDQGNVHTNLLYFIET